MVMANKDNNLCDEHGKFLLNEGYKHITAGNASEALDLIKNQLSHIMQGQYTQSKRTNYYVESHMKPFDWGEYEKCKSANPFRREEWICKHCYCESKGFESVGQIVDYQVPLKHSKQDSESSSVGMGKIDLLAKKGDIGYLLEVKVPASTEAPLRAIMEIYTYWQQLGGNDSQHFCKNSRLGGAKELKKGIVIYKSTEKKSIYQKLESSIKELRSLMDSLGVECFIAEPSDQDGLIRDIVPWK